MDTARSILSEDFEALKNAMVQERIRRQSAMCAASGITLSGQTDYGLNPNFLLGGDSPIESPKESPKAAPVSPPASPPAAGSPTTMFGGGGVLHGVARPCRRQFPRHFARCASAFYSSNAALQRGTSDVRVNYGINHRKRARAQEA